MPVSGFVQPLAADDPRLPQFEQTPAETCLAALDACQTHPEPPTWAELLERLKIITMSAQLLVDRVDRLARHRSLPVVERFARIDAMLRERGAA